MAKTIYSSTKIVVKNNRPFVHDNQGNKDIVFNSDVLKNNIPFREGVELPFGCNSVPSFINGTYPIKVDYQLEGRISGGYQTVAIVLSIARRLKNE